MYMLTSLYKDCLPRRLVLKKMDNKSPKLTLYFLGTKSHPGISISGCKPRGSSCEVWGEAVETFLSHLRTGKQKMGREVLNTHGISGFVLREGRATNANKSIK